MYIISNGLDVALTNTSPAYEITPSVFRS